MRRITGIFELINADTFIEDWHNGQFFILNGITDFGNLSFSNGLFNNSDICLDSEDIIVTNKGELTYDSLQQQTRFSKF